MLEMRALLNRRLTQLGQRVEGYFQKTPAHARARLLLISLERHNSLRTASAMAFDLFLAIIPMLGLAGFAAAHLLHSQPQALAEGSRLLDLAPARLHGFIVRNLNAFAETELAPLFALLALWLSSAAFFTMIRVFEESFDCQRRSWLSARVLALGFALVGLALFVLATAAGALLTWHGLVSAEQKHQISKLVALAPPALRQFRPVSALAFVASALSIMGYLGLIYRFAVVRPVKRRYVPGAVIATSIGLLGSFLLAYYVTHLGRYALFYGSLAIIVVVMLWLWLWCSAILIGAEINVALEDALADTTAAVGSSPALDQGADSEPTGPTQMPSATGNPDGD